ncbi:hypothetical protein B0J13DRAFT_594450 [Dactylonectria estremocensis]|uniref:Inner centromere protein ARK-binding domain-containing protein n=1 Tax=Dactylonectria estremocensis TaxID=1079267 RepID=A0A9P9J4S7_9HYPO|nr:hypothetical protein B0J13DRAFT_594450 [Dactylonectria estremocensis]
MAAMRGPRLQVGSAAWVAEERASALQIADSEVEEFTYSARNELDWLNEHMAGIFNENETNIAETFKTPGKLRGKTPRTARKVQPGEPRVPLSNVFGATPSSTANRFAQQLNKTQSPRLHPGSPSPVKNGFPRRDLFSPKPTQPQPATQDSGYYGSQDIGSMDVDMVDNDISLVDQAAHHVLSPAPVKEDLSRSTPLQSPDKTLRPVNEDQTTRVLSDHSTAATSSPAKAEKPSENEDAVTSPLMSRPASATPSLAETHPGPGTTDEVEPTEAPLDLMSPGDARSPSDASSPIRPVVRKSSLNFASLPAREPLTAGKSAGARVSRTSHLDFNRTSYYNRHTGGKSLGNHGKQDPSDDEDHDDEMDVDDFPSVPAQESQEPEDFAIIHNKTYTQRLQDQINRLGKSQPNGSRPSKSVHSLTSLQQPSSAAPHSVQETTFPSPKKQETTTTPGAFPEDDDDDWIDPPAVEPTLPKRPNSRPTLTKSHSTEVREEIHSKDTVGSEAIQAEMQAKTRSPLRGFTMPQRPSILGHGKSMSASVIPTTISSEHQDGSPLKKTVTVSNPSFVMDTVLEKTQSQTPSKSPSRSFRDSPLKQVKNKLSSILKSSKGLLASSAAISAEGKSSILSPSTTHLGTYPAPSMESVIPKASFESLRMDADSPSRRDGSPPRPAPRRTRASVEREKEEKRREREAMHMAEQMEKLEKARDKEREKVRVFSKEQEKIAAMEKQVASKKETEHTVPKETPKPTRSSPRKAKAQQTTTSSTDQDTDMADALITVPPSASRPQSTRTKEVRKPLKPGKAKQVPTVIRVNTGSQHSQFQPANSTMSTGFQDTLGPTSSQSQQHLGSKASKASLQPKPSMQSLKSSVSSTGRPKALDMAARKKEQDEREAQRRRDAKAEFERKRAAAQEEQRKQELQRRQETERQKAKEREQTDAKKSSQRQAAIEKAKQTRAPPPAVRSQPNGPPDHSTSLDKSQRDDRPPTRPPSRMNSGIFRSQEDAARPVNAVLSNASKSVLKRALGQDGNEPGQARHAPSYGAPQYHGKDAKRRRTSDDFADELEADNPPNIKGPPVRPSGGFKKDLQAKSVFQNGYSNVPQSATRDLFKATVTAQHASQSKASHPLDMAQISKGAIPFAPNPNQSGQAYKTPARPGAMNGAKSVVKSALRSSPRFQNGESIELPEIMTDDDDDDDDDASHGMTAAAWADSPDLRRALMRQEMMDPSQIFGPPAPLNMDEVFSKNKERSHKFRARTSSANWSGVDRLTEEDIRKDLAARDKMRREGGWSYEMSRDMM